MVSDYFNCFKVDFGHILWCEALNFELSLKNVFSNTFAGEKTLCEILFFFIL